VSETSRALQAKNNNIGQFGMTRKGSRESPYMAGNGYEHIYNRLSTFGYCAWANGYIYTYLKPQLDMQPWWPEHCFRIALQFEDHIYFRKLMQHNSMLITTLSTSWLSLHGLQLLPQLFPFLPFPISKKISQWIWNPRSTQLTWWSGPLLCMACTSQLWLLFQFWNRRTCT